ncbi:MAG: poly-beta-hydroxybutyrate polymerase N-terminal domain-containing protein [Alkalilacustris sp.]
MADGGNTLAKAAYHDFVDPGARSLIGQATRGLARSAFWVASADWAMHLGMASGKQTILA